MNAVSSLPAHRPAPGQGAAAHDAEPAHLHLRGRADRRPPGERPPPPPIYLPPPPPPPGHCYGGHWDDHDHDDEWVAGLVAGTFGDGAVVAASQDDDAVTTTTVTTSGAVPNSVLPCEPKIMTANGATCYLCGSQFYVQACGDGGLIYVPLEPPR